jgi:hypothetical protein
MSLQVSPDAPPILHFAAAGLLVLHIGGGAVGMVSGFAAMALRKGGRAHRLAGDVFTLAMLTMAGIGAGVAPFLPTQQWSNTLAGVFTLYLVTTAWVGARRRPGQVGRFEVGALVVALGSMITALTGVWVNAHGGADSGDGASTDGLYMISTLATIAVAGDVHQLWRRGLTGAPRLARHIWRTSLALLIATVSFFLGQPKFVPPVIRDSFLVAVPVLAPLALMLFWQIKVRIPRAHRAKAARQISTASSAA